jgi:hypothetical protein
VEKVYKVLTEEGKDVRKAEWTNKEVSTIHSLFRLVLILGLSMFLCGPKTAYAHG